MKTSELLVFTVTPSKIQNRLIGEVQNLGNERRDVSKYPRQDSVQCKFQDMQKILRNQLTQIYRALNGDAMLQGVCPDGHQQGSGKQTETSA